VRGCVGRLYTVYVMSLPDCSVGCTSPLCVCLMLGVRAATPVSYVNNHAYTHTHTHTHARIQGCWFGVHAWSGSAVCLRAGVVVWVECLGDDEISVGVRTRVCVCVWL
jgi:hypothetical protein